MIRLCKRLPCYGKPWCRMGKKSQQLLDIEICERNLRFSTTDSTKKQTHPPECGPDGRPLDPSHPCWSCHVPLKATGFFCSGCHIIQVPPILPADEGDGPQFMSDTPESHSRANYFELFDQPVSFVVDLEKTREKYHKLQKNASPGSIHCEVRSREDVFRDSQRYSQQGGGCTPGSAITRAPYFRRARISAQ
eukprot:1012334_1